MERHQVWPRTNKLGLDWFEEHAQLDLRISKATRIVSLGSCFAREIKNWLLRYGYNYLVGETDKSIWRAHEVYPGDRGVPPTEHASIAWERVYNTFCFRQIAEYSFGVRDWDCRVVPFEHQGKTYYRDLLRTRIVYETRDDADTDIRDHQRISKEFFERAQVVVVTLGLTEIFESKTRSMVLGGTHDASVPDDFRFRATTYAENLDNLEAFFGLIRDHNPNVEFLLTVSPVHLKATFRSDLDVISASCASKSILRAVADVLTAGNDRLHYFPSYEMATILAPLRGVNVYPDNHHVSADIVDVIMGTFQAKCVAG